MTNISSILSQILWSLGTQIPVLIVLVGGAGMAISRWRESRDAALWALPGFGLALFVTCAAPVTQALVQRLFLTQTDMVRQMPTVFTALAVFWSILRAVSYALILIAVFVGRSTKTASPSPNSLIPPRAPGF